MSAPRILVIDDDQDNCLLTASLLRDDGHEVDTAYDGLSALKLFGEESHDLVILDYRMPDMDGMDVLETMKSQWPDVSVVFYTAYATIDMIEAALAAGAKRVIPKDTDSTELLEVVRQLLKPVGDV
jgi:CheY-like chemotaxis protein